MDQSHYFGSGSESNIHPVVLLLLVVAVLLLSIGPRKYLLYVFIASAVLIPLSQVAVIGGLHFMVLRIVVLVGGVRLLFGGYLNRNRPPWNGLTKIDKAFLAWLVVHAAMFTILWGEMGALVNQMGMIYTNLGIYVFLRCMIQEDAGVEQAIKAFAFVCFICGIFMLSEQFTGRNVFGYWGTNPPLQVVLREGRLRSQGPFFHPLLAGAFGATSIPLFYGLWRKGKSSRLSAAAGIIGASLMAITSFSSTSVIALGAGALALAAWPLRRKMRSIRWMMATSVVGLHLVMKAPVWALIARLDITGGSSGYHRYELINQTILRFREWWLVGTTAQAEWGWDMWDSINWYVDQCTSGGLLTFFLFLAVIVYAFKAVGKMRAAAEASGNRTAELFAWAIGACVFSNAIAFIGISYFDQSIVVWLGLLAILSAIPVVVEKPNQDKPLSFGTGTGVSQLGVLRADSPGKF